jgi:hypothetical protein
MIDKKTHIVIGVPQPGHVGLYLSCLKFEVVKHPLSVDELLKLICSKPNQG